MMRRNFCINPACKTTNMADWSGPATVARTTSLTGLPRTTGATLTSVAGGTFINAPPSAPGLLAPGDVMTVSIYYKNSSPNFTFSKTIFIGYKRSSGGDVFPQSFSTGTIGAPGSIVRASFTTAAAPALATQIFLLLDNWNSNDIGYEFTGLLYEKVGALDAYFDGDTPLAVWDGTDGNSSSTLNDANPGMFMPFFTV